MAEILLTLHCAADDAAAIGEALRDAFRTPVHVRTEDVLGLDFSDASTAERVTARLDRRAIELVMDGDRLDDAGRIITALNRAGPVRWLATPVIARGRVA